MSNIFIKKKGPPKKVNKPKGKVVQFQFRKPKARQLKLRFGMKNTFSDIF
mgnify:CR=1 FL=1